MRGLRSEIVSRLQVSEIFGLSPLDVRAREAWLALRGGDGVPPSRFDLTSLEIFRPSLSLKTWLGRRRADRRRRTTWRALVSVGDIVARGEPIALSGYSGIDGLFAFPWSVPHVHFNVWLDGEYADPFATHGETALWRDGNDPRPYSRARHGADAFAPTKWDARGVDEAIAACTSSVVRAELTAETSLDRRAMNLLFYRNYYPTRFASAPRVVTHAQAREPRLTLPFRADDFVGIAFPD